MKTPSSHPPMECGIYVDPRGWEYPSIPLPAGTGWPQTREIDNQTVQLLRVEHPPT